MGICHRLLSLQGATVSLVDQLLHLWDIGWVDSDWSCEL